MSDEKVTAKNSADFIRLIKEREIQFIDFNFTDFKGKWQHTTQHVDTVDKELIDNGVYFDGSSIAGWKAINESDMLLKPDYNKITLDPFAAQATIKIFCDVWEPGPHSGTGGGSPYSRDPRSVAKAAEAYLASTGLGDTVNFGPEAEFFIFDDVKYTMDQHHVSYTLDSHEGPWNTGTVQEGGNLGHRPRVKGGYFPEAPVDSCANLRAEMITVMRAMGVPVEKHHHEVAASQHELGIKYSSLVDSADNIQLYKHVVHNVADSYGKTATFMPKPVYGDNGSGMHVHQSIFQAGKPMFAGDLYAGLSEMALFYIGGIIKHAKALNAFTNPTTNSYKRLVPGYEAPVLLAYSARNRSASCRIPHSASPKGKRVEVRFPDPLANPYFAFAGMLMAGLDGIQNKIHPGEAMDANLYELPKHELAKVPTVCGSLREALRALEADHEFLTKGNVFSMDLIEGYIDLKMQEVEAFETSPHPIEYMMYYSS